ncbi:hypothetical protein MPL3356_490014 [Mesorhizobium plurifarium]|uniref:Transposase n=1 Tax=Mesorhizobium plurifarium TaxID=69974 RepID=A0A090EB28_MESPL|nr:hypothetical protein MPL3356_490014 [Mesorhizobium plurifarium]CDX61631.1 hypothetical protein MPL3365_660003 [Mesorhizobium plurifarium]
MSDATFYKWRSKYGGMDVSEAKRLKSLEEENGKAEAPAGRRHARRLDLARDARKKLLTPGSRRNAVSWAMEEKGYSQRRACGLVGIDPRVYRYRSTRPDDAELRGRLKELASQPRRFGYRRLQILLRREGLEVTGRSFIASAARNGSPFANVAAASGPWGRERR